MGLLARSQPELDLAKLEIEHPGGTAVKIRADVRDFEQMSAAVDRMQVVFGGTHALICCAGTLGPIGPFVETRPDAWHTAFDVNVIGVVNSCRAVLPQMMDRRSGKIIVMVGGGSSAGRPFLAAHAATKAALVRLVESMAEEVFDYNVQINCMDPGSCYTSMTDEILHAGDRVGAKEMEEAQRIRVTGGTQPEKQTQLALFLSSPGSNHISGKLLLATEDWKKLERQNMQPDLYTLRRSTKG